MLTEIRRRLKLFVSFQCYSFAVLIAPEVVLESWRRIIREASKP